MTLLEPFGTKWKNDFDEILIATGDKRPRAIC